ncbi:hypothetical protein Tco_0245144, partial [Tanacetum coccineum]
KHFPQRYVAGERFATVAQIASLKNVWDSRLRWGLSLGIVSLTSIPQQHVDGENLEMSLGKTPIVVVWADVAMCYMSPKKQVKLQMSCNLDPEIPLAKRYRKIQLNLKYENSRPQD